MREEYGKIIKALEKGALKRLTDAHTGAECFLRGDEIIFSSPDFSPSGEIIEETVALRPTLVLFGFGHIGKSVYRIAKMIGFPLVIFDDRADVTKDGPYEAPIVIDSYENIFSRKYDFTNPYFLIFTHGHKADEDALYYVLRNYDARYVGMIGSSKKISLTYSHLKERGIKEESLESVHSPVGLDINAESPEEIALSIMAEIIKTYREGKRQITIEENLFSFLEKEEKDVIKVRIIGKSGSGPRESGAEMAVTENTTHSTIGGGAIENECIHVARDMLKRKERFSVLDFDLEKDSPLGMACGGKAKVILRKV